MRDIAELIHHIPGRMRLRIRAAKGNPGKLTAIERSLEGLSGVRLVEIKPTLGTIIIQYDRDLFTGFMGKLADYAMEHDLFAIGERKMAAPVSNADRSIKGFFGTLDRTVQSAVGNAISLKELLPLALGFYGLAFVDKAAAAAQWLNWIQFAIGTYMDLHQQQPIGELGQTMEAHFADVTAQQSQSAEVLRRELAELRSQLQAVSDKIAPR